MWKEEGTSLASDEAVLVDLRGLADTEEVEKEHGDAIRDRPMGRSAMTLETRHWARFVRLVSLRNERQLTRKEVMERRRMAPCWPTCLRGGRRRGHGGGAKGCDS
mmetsp:Transcript_50612/g.107824  ORF Transcript_50612/g.107824 Transcript_50612/m.107824 type:complete len:105 (+) Transcript_50612:566-880(+)